MMTWWKVSWTKSRIKQQAEFVLAKDKTHARNMLQDRHGTHMIRVGRIVEWPAGPPKKKSK